MDEHFGYKKRELAGNKTGNSRNGTSSKTIRSSNGEIKLDIPSDSNAIFELIVFHQNKRRLGGIGGAIIFLYAKALPTSDIYDYLEEICGNDMNPQFI
ncbi:MAG: transposase [bacterium]